MTEDEVRYVQTLEGQIHGLTLALVRVAKAGTDPGKIATELDMASEQVSGDTARAEGCALMLQLIASAIRQEAPKPGDWVKGVIQGGKE